MLMNYMLTSVIPYCLYIPGCSLYFYLFHKEYFHHESCQTCKQRNFYLKWEQKYEKRNSIITIKLSTGFKKIIFHSLRQSTASAFNNNYRVLSMLSNIFKKKKNKNVSTRMPHSHYHFLCSADSEVKTLFWH